MCTTSLPGLAVRKAGCVKERESGAAGQSFEGSKVCMCV